MLSPSSINLFIEEPALWVLKQFFDIRTEMNIFAVRGRLVEEVLNKWYETGKVPTFKSLTPGMIDETLFVDSHVDIDTLKGFHDWGKECVKVFKDNVKDKPIKMQGKVEGDICGLNVGGYLDYEYDDYIIDLKTTNKVPIVVSRGEREGLISKTKAANIRQQLVYSKLTGKPVRLMYIDQDGNHLYYKVTKRDKEEHWADVEKNIEKIKKLLTLTRKSVIKEVEPKNLNSFYWDKVTKEFAEKLWSK
jgi:hypothetical protein